MFSRDKSLLQPIIQKANRQSLLIVGATHGNEPAGIQALETLVGHLQNQEWDIEGIDIFGVVGNPEALAKNTRFIDENLNRMFQSERLAEPLPKVYEVRRAQELSSYFAELKGKYEKVFICDVHSVSGEDTQMTVYRKGDAESAALLQKISPINLNFVFEEEHLPGTISGYSCSIGCVGFGIEAGSHNSDNSDKADNARLVALDIIERLLDEVAIFAYKAVSYQGAAQYIGGGLRTYETIQRIIPKNNFVFIGKSYSEMSLSQGQVYAYNELIGEHRAPCACYMMMPSKFPLETDWDAGFLCIKV